MDILLFIMAYVTMSVIKSDIQIKLISMHSFSPIGQIVQWFLRIYFEPSPSPMYDHALNFAYDLLMLSCMYTGAYKFVNPLEFSSFVQKYYLKHHQIFSQSNK